MRWRGALVRGVIVLLALFVWRQLFLRFPDIGPGAMVVLALTVAGIGYLADSMFDGYLSLSGRALVGFVVTFAVLAIAFSQFVYPHEFIISYAAFSVLTGVVVALGDLVLGRAFQKRLARPS